MLLVVAVFVAAAAVEVDVVIAVVIVVDVVVAVVVCVGGWRFSRKSSRHVRALRCNLNARVCVGICIDARPHCYAK